MQFRTILYTTLCSLSLITGVHGMDDQEVGTQALTLLGQTPSLIHRAVVIGSITRFLAQPFNKALDHWVVNPESHPYISCGTKYIISAKPISSTVDQCLTNLKIIPQAPPAQNFPHSVAQMVIGAAAGYASNRAINKVLSNLKRNYNKKDNIVASEERYLKSDQYTIKPGVAQNWTQSIFFTCSNESRRRDEDTDINDFYCNIFQKNYGIAVDEKLNDDDLTIDYRTHYYTKETYWQYNRPFGIHAFRPAIKDLFGTVRANHVTLIGETIADVLKKDL